MSWNHWIRQIHRWVSVIFTVLVAAVFATNLSPEEPAEWVYLLPLLPLFLLFVTGAYLFALPYLARWRGARRGDLANRTESR